MAHAPQTEAIVFTVNFTSSCFLQVVTFLAFQCFVAGTWWKFHYCHSRSRENASQDVERFNSILRTRVSGPSARAWGKSGGEYSSLCPQGDPGSGERHMNMPG